MPLKHIFFFTLFIFTTQAFHAQSKKKTFEFPLCDTLNEYKLVDVLNTEIKSTDEEITKWLKKHSEGKTLNTGAEFSFILDSNKGVCLKKLTVFDSTNTNIKDLKFLIQKLSEYPEFKQLAKHSSKTKILRAVVYFDRAKNQHKIGLMPTFKAE